MTRTVLFGTASSLIVAAIVLVFGTMYVNYSCKFQTQRSSKEHCRFCICNAQHYRHYCSTCGHIASTGMVSRSGGINIAHHSCMILIPIYVILLIFPGKVGLSVDYAVHVCIAYVNQVQASYQQTDRLVLTRGAVAEIGASIVGGAVTTATAVLMLFFCHITFFAKVLERHM